MTQKGITLIRSSNQLSGLGNCGTQYNAVYVNLKWYRRNIVTEDKKLNELEKQLVPTPDIDLSVPADEPEPDVAESVAKSMDK